MAQAQAPGGMMAEFLPGLVTAWGLLLLGLITPGPSVMMIVSTATERGRGSALTLVLGVAMGTASWSALACFGLAALLATMPWLEDMLRLIGAVIFAWLAIRAMRAAQNPSPAPRAAVAGDRLRLALTGLGVHLTNPKAAAVWIGLAAVGTGAGAPLPLLLLFIAGCFTLSFSINALWGLAFSNEAVQRGYLGWRRVIQSVIGALFGAASVHLLLMRT